MTLTTRQQQVIRLIATGAIYKEIASQLGISIQGVQHNVDRIKLVIPVRSTADLTRYALAKGLAKNEFLKTKQRKKTQ